MNKKILYFILAMFCLLQNLNAAKNSEVTDSIKNQLNASIDIALRLTNFDSDSATLLINEGLKIAEEYNFIIEKARILRVKGLIQFYKVNYSGALDYFIESQNLCKESAYKLGEATAVESIGLVYSYQGLEEKAMQLRMEALNIRLEINDSLGIAASYNNIAVGYQNTKNFAKALEYYFKALQMTIKLNEISDLSLIYNNIAFVYLNQHKLDSVLPYYHKSLAVSREYNNRQYEGNSYEGIGKYYLRKGNKIKALKYYEKSLAIYKEIGIVYEIEAAVQSLHEIYASLGNYKEAYKMHLLLKQMADSANSVETMQKITSIEAKAEHKKEQELQLLKQEKSDIEKELQITRQKQIRNTSFVFLIALLILLIYAYRNYLRKNKLSKDLMMQRDEILTKNEEIAAQRDEIIIQHKTLEHQTKELTTHRQNTLDSLSYAEHIQGSLLASDTGFEQAFNDHFIFYKPKDIVSGDFYWLKQKNGNTLIAAADCTGHGVPGAFMSIMGISFLNEIIQKQEMNDPAGILEKLRFQVKTTLNPELKTNRSSNYIDLYLDAEIKDGMDIAFCSINKASKQLTFCGANLPLFIIRNNKLIELEANDNPVGVYLIETPFENTTYQLEENDMVYMFSDGYYDQFGGEENKKFFIDRFKDLLLSIHTKPCANQKHVINETIENWMGVHSQIDDMLVMGLRI